MPLSKSDFEINIDLLLNSAPLLAEDCIRKVLTSLVADGERLAVVKDACKSFDLEKEYVRYCVRDKVLPTERTTLIALVTSLLYLFDDGSLRVIDFATEFFGIDDTEKAYNAFLTDIVKPYSDAMDYLLIGEPVDDVKAPSAGSIDKMGEDLNNLLDSLVGYVNKNVSDRKIIEDVTEAVNGLRHTLPFSDALLTKTAFKGLFFTLQYYRLQPDNLSDIMSLLIIYGVL